MRWTLMAPQDERRCRGRRSRAVPIPRRWYQACGSRPGRRRWQKSPAHRGDHEGNRKTIAQGMPECLGLPVV